MPEEKKDSDPEVEVVVLTPKEWLHALGIHDYRTNPPPVNPFEGRPAEEMSPNEVLLNDVFDHGGWRIDCGRPLACVHSEKILASLQELKDRSPYVTVVHEPTGITALHAAAINGFEDIFRALVENGGMDPLAPALPLKFAASSKTEYVKGPDCIWIGRRRNHKALVKYMSGLPAVASELKELAIELEKQVKAHKKRVLAFKKKMMEEEAKRKKEEERRAAEEARKREFEEKQRAFRKEILEYNQMLKGMLEEVNAGAWQEWTTGPDESLRLLKSRKDDTESEERQIKVKDIRAKELDVERDMKRPKETLRVITAIVDDYTTMWDAVVAFQQFKKEKLELDWIPLDPGKLEEDIRAQATILKRLPKSTKKSNAFKGVDTECKDLLNAAPVFIALHSSCMRVRHWEEIILVTKAISEDIELSPPYEAKDGASSEKFGEDFEDQNWLTVQIYYELNLHTPPLNVPVEEVTDKAAKEQKQETALGEFRERWKGIKFLSSPYQRDQSVPLLRMGEEDFEFLEGDLLVLQGMVASRYDFWKVPSKENGNVGSTVWQLELQTLSEVILMVTELQRMWSYLEPLFMGSEEVKKELPEDAVKFAEIDAKVRERLKQMAEVSENQNARASANLPGLLKELEQLQTGQEVCKKALVDFMDGKRRKFARFYFVSEVDLLDILSNGSTPKSILKHVDKVLLSTKQLQLDESSGGERPVAAGFVAGVGKESMPFEPPVPLEGKVEIYLQDVLSGQKKSLQQHLKRSHSRYEKQARHEWVSEMKPSDGGPADAAQIILLVAAIYYVNEVEAALKMSDPVGTSLPTQLNKIQEQLENLIKLTRTNLDSGIRKKVMCMITLDAHSRDIVQKLIFKKVDSADKFDWMSQLKQRYLPDTLDAQVDILNASFLYDYEYLGNGSRLVVTPLTDRIYVTATQALHLCMGCAPAGPAGTGKTESTKDLASALAICCYVVNCSPEMDYVSMGNIFKGLAASGSWGCFDEFNRLIPEVLSVCSVQFKAVCVAVKGYDPNEPLTHLVTVEGDTVTLIPKCGAFITMNPGYLGRSELPEGLKALFRPITVMVPDLVLICENFLMAEGFVDAKMLASKFFCLYSLLKDLLSKQDHYDWGLRAIKSVLVVAGQLLRSSVGVPEDQVLMRALRDFNVPKIVSQDEVVFHGLLGDLFPGLNPARVFDEQLQEAVIEACGRLKYHAHETAVLKAVQLQELLDIRHCVFTMGPPGSAKSSCWKTLRAARDTYDPEAKKKTTDMKVKVTDVNPKVMATQDLYGYINMTTREWKDGLLSNVMRSMGQGDERPKWLVLDGDLDANWIESMNSVMDDNKMLTLASNERIPVKPYMRLIFEIRDLKYATPATVSRAGILYISADSGFQWQSIIESWILSRDSSFSDAHREELKTLFNKYVPQILKFMKKSMHPIVRCEDTNLVMCLLRFLEALLTPKALKSQVENIFEASFVFAAVWAFGSALSIGDDGTNYKKNFSDWWKRTFKTVPFPSQGLIFDYFLLTENLTPDGEEAGTFATWDVSPAFKEVEFDSRTMSMSEITVPTGETASVTYWSNHLVDGGYPVMLCGLAGTGKTQIINGLLRDLDAASYLHQVINMNFYTSGTALQAILETALQKQTATRFGPPPGTKMVYFIDDLNLPLVDPYNTQSAISLMRQHCDYEHWYDMTKLTLKDICNCQYVSCMNPTAGSFLIDPRLQRWFTTFAVAMPNEASLTTIYQTYLEGHLKNGGFSDAILETIPHMINGTLAVHQHVSESFRKTAANFHYEFNIRHMAGVFQGLLMATSGKFTTPDKLAFMWCHECERVYGDRLVSYDDLEKFYKIMVDQGKKAFPSYQTQKFYMTPDNLNPNMLVFCHFGEGIDGDKIYDQMTDETKLSHILYEGLESYNESNIQMDLVLFNDAMRHICKITRIINNPAGHALLVGVGGSGKQSLSRLSSSICDYDTVMITISATYGVNDLKADLQAMYAKAGIQQKGVTFLFTDNQITNEKFLVYINDLLNSGRIADLYAPDEKDTVCNDVAGKAKAAGWSQEPAALYDFFISQVRKNLHMIICCSPVGDDFRNRCLKFPALVNCTVIDWFQPWPEEALFSVGKKAIEHTEFDSEQTRESIENFLPLSFKQVSAMQAEYMKREGRPVYTTPKSYLELLKLYNKVLNQTRVENDKQQYRLVNGIKRLEECGAVVDKLKTDLAVMLAAATEKAKVADGIATTVASEKQVVEMESENAAIESKKVEQIQKDVTEQRESAEKDLAEAEPAVERAMAALDTLEVKDLNACKGMQQPPPGVGEIFAAVMVLLAKVTLCETGKLIPAEKSGKVRDKNRDWGTCKKVLMKDVKVLVADLKQFKDMYEKGGVPALNFKEVRQYIAMDFFNYESILTKNSAAAGLCNWVVNIVIYYDVVVGVEPKRKALAEATVTLEQANQRLQEVKEKVATLEARLAKLSKEFDAANKDKAEAEATVEKGTIKLDLAQRLIKALSSENVRWNKGVKTLDDSKVRLIGDSLLASAFISYIGPFTKEFRDILVYEKWVPVITEGGIPISDPASPLKVLTNESEIAKWNTQGLPADPVSSENGAIVCRSSRWPLMIDPQLQGIAWVRNMEGSNPDRPLIVVRLENKDIIYKLKDALENGLPFLIENMGEKIDATLMPVVQRSTTKRGTKQYLKLGDDEVELHKDFQLYMHTKLSNPHYPPEIQAEATLVNFTVTPGGLEDQLLSLVVRKERPDLAAQKAALIQQQNQCMIKIKELEDEILGRLAAAEGDITEDKDLIEGLENAKKLSNDINKQLELGRKTSKQINMTSEKYRPTARRGSQLFFIMQQLSKVHTYYIYSLNAYVVVFSSAIDMVQAADKANKSKTSVNSIAGGGTAAAKLRGLKRLKKFTENIIGQLRRFPWSHNILLQAAGDDGMDTGLLQTFFTGVVEGPKGDIFYVGDTVDTSFGTGKILEEQEDPHLYLVELRNSAINEKSMKMFMAAGSVRKYIDYDKRTSTLSDKITNVVFNYVRRGLFDRDKLLVTTLMFFTLQVADNRLEQQIVDTMLQNKQLEQADPENPEEIPAEIADWMPEMAYRKALQVASDMTKIVPDMATLKGQFTGPDSGAWEAWLADSKPEEQPMPGSLKDLPRQYRLPILRALRPDRVTFALTEYIDATEGNDYVFQPPFDMAKTYRESSASTPIFFVLFPGVDPTPWVENLGKTFDITQENGKFVNISMGQGQEAPAEAKVEHMAKIGGWVMLQNLHLMQSWLPALERKLEVCSTSAHKDFRCFCSAEPPSFSYMRNMPESLMQSCIKVSNEAPSDLKSNILRAWDAFSPDRLKCVPEQMNNFKTCLFGLCFFHSVMLGRKKYGQQGWSRKYGFNTGDLTICGDVLEAYIRNAKTYVPWDDLRYVFGEIMYGGHITDFWDRRVDNNYLSLIFQDSILCKQGELGPGFRTPDPAGRWYEDYKQSVMETLPPESPPMYGLHENSEIAYLNAGTETIFNTILRLRAGSGGGGGGGMGVNDTISELLNELPSKFDLMTLEEKAKPLMATEQQPYVLVAKQESGRMNILLAEIHRSLEELQKGLAGSLNMTNLMEELLSSLKINQVPGRNPFHKASWEKLAWFSMKPLSSWFPDMILRCDALRSWGETLKLPFSLWLPSLFNPTSFLTAIKQATARAEKLPLDNMATETHCTSMLQAEEADHYPADGAFVHGLYIEGARWQDANEAGNYTSDVSGEKIMGILVESRPRQLLTTMPLIYMKAVVVQKDWDPQAVGFIRPEKDIYNCPCYTTTFRGNTFVFVATLKTEERAEKWISAGVALVFQTDD